MKPSALLLLLTFIYNFSFSQNGNSRGYYINTSGDTIPGTFPKFKPGGKNPSEVKFIISGNKEILLTPQNCNSFVVENNESYIAYEGLRMINPIEEARLGTENIAETYDSIHTFLRSIYQSSNVSLYSYKDKTRENFFYKKSNKEIVELKKSLSFYYSGDNKLSSSTNEFRDQLKQQFPEQIDAKQLQGRLNNLGYTENDLVKFMHLLNETTASNKSTKHPTKLFIGLGASFNSLDISGRDDLYLETQVNHKSPISPVFTFGAQFYAGRTGRLLIKPSVNIYSFSANGEVDLTSGTAEYSHESDFQANLIIRPTASLGYNIINQDGLKWHASLGMGFAFLLDASETQTTRYPASSTVTERDPNSMVFVFSAETGLEIGKHMGIWVNYQPPANTSDVVNKAVKISSLQIGVNWLFRAGK